MKPIKDTIRSDLISDHLNLMISRNSELSSFNHVYDVLLKDGMRELDVHLFITTNKDVADKLRDYISNTIVK